MKINSRHEIRGEKKKTRVVQQLPKTGFAKRRASEKETAVWTRLISFELFFFFFVTRARLPDWEDGIF